MPAYSDPDALQKLYRIRFSDPIADEIRHATWSVLCEKWFPQFVKPSDAVLELGAGECEFINGINAARKIAVDLNPDVANSVGAGVEFLQQSAVELTVIPDESVDVVFSSNFFEHLGDAQTLLAVMGEAHRVLRPGGSLITLMPNFRAVGPRFFDYLDHTLPLTDKSLVDAHYMTGFTPELVIPRFLPYTAAARRKPVNPRLVKLYLRVPLAWRVMGGQMFVVASKDAH